MSIALSSMLVVPLLVALLLNPAHGFGGLSMTVSSGNLQSSAASPSLERHNLFAVRTQSHEREKKEWINRSVNYYTKVMREERRRTMGQIDALQESKPDYRDEFLTLAKKHYFARYKIKNGRPQHAEQIYLRIIDELSQEEDGHCDHAKMAVTTLLLALLRQRMGDSKGTRSAFLNFFRIAFLDMDEDTECACSAKVLQAYALFEMKQGNSLKSLDLATKAIKLDDSLKPILQWKQFRDALERVSANKLARA